MCLCQIEPSSIACNARLPHLMKRRSLPRILKTVSYLKPLQVLCFFWRRVIGQNKVKPAENATLRGLLAPKSWLFSSSEGVEPWVFRFLNHSRSFSEGNIDWQAEGESRLWRYNLHYFDYLLDTTRPDSVKHMMLDSWITNNPQLLQPAWEPYTASLRVANWVKFFIKRPDAVTDFRIISLFTQARWLRKNLERHILANHYFENLKALVFAGAFFAGDEADSWVKFATRELSHQLKEQTLTDGCHYERTPSYHCVMLKNYLELTALFSANESLASPVLSKLLRQTTEHGMYFLRSILFPGNRIPLFNDSAFNSAPSPNELFDYAASLGISVCSKSIPRTVNYADAGIFGYVTENDGILVDCGEIGPRYQPGHTHCDFLSYELVLNNEALIVDTGVFEYEPGAMRNYVRSTLAHNTISVDGAEQSELWGEFRVANRAKRLTAQLTAENSKVEFSGSYRGFFSLGGKVEHHRTVEIELAANSIQAITVRDKVLNASGKRIDSFVHVHPSVQIENDLRGQLALTCGKNKYMVKIPNELEYRVDRSFYCPEFGNKLDNFCIVISLAEPSQKELTYRIEKTV